MKTKLLKLTCGLALLGAVISTPAQSTMDIFGTGSGTLNGVGFSNEAFDWTLTFSTDNPNLVAGANNPIYTLSSSQITLQGVGTPINVTQEEGLWINIDPSYLSTAPIRMNGSTFGVGGDILTIYDGTHGWDTVSAFTSYASPGGAFNQFNNIATDQGSLTMNSGSVSLVTISGITPTPEPSTLALAGLGGLGMLWQLRRRK